MLFVILQRARTGTNPPIQFVSTPTLLYTKKEAAEVTANDFAKSNPKWDYFVFECMSQHSARIEVDVRKP